MTGTPAAEDGKALLKAYNEDYHVGLWLTGNRVESSWAHKDEESSFYELKAYVQNVFRRMGLSEASLQISEIANDIYSGALEYKTRGGKTIAIIGVVKNSILKMFDLQMPVYYADIFWDELLKATRKAKVLYTELSKFPSVRRDLALLIDKSVKFCDIEKFAHQVESKLLKDVFLFDVYEGKNLEPGKKSYAIGFILQDESQTLNEVQIEKVMEKLVRTFQDKLDAKLR